MGRIIISHKRMTLFKGERVFLLVWIGTLLLVLGSGIWWYSESNIRSKEQLLNGNLTPDQRNEISGSLSWWENTQIKLYDPIAFTLITSGIICALCALALMVLQSTRKTRN